jgi:hypothetical protein
MTGQIYLDGLDVHNTYNMIAIRGSYSDLLRLPDMKEPSSYSWDTEDGDDVELTGRKYADRDIKLTFLMSASDMSKLMPKRAALFAALKADGYRTLSVTSLGRSWQLYYKSCESTKFINAGKKRLELVLKFRLHGESTAIV